MGSYKPHHKDTNSPNLHVNMPKVYTVTYKKITEHIINKETVTYNQTSIHECISHGQNTSPYVPLQEVHQGFSITENKVNRHERQLENNNIKVLTVICLNLINPDVLQH